MYPLISSYLFKDPWAIPIYLLCLKEKPERVELTRARLIEGGHPEESLNVEYGIYAKDNPESLEEAMTKWRISPSYLISLSEAACACGHLEIINKISQSNYNEAIIVEDDLLLPRNWKRLFPKLIKLIPQDADMVFFGWCRGETIPPDFRDDHPYIKYKPTCLHAYFITRNGARKIIKEAGRVSCAIDVWLSLNADKIGLTMYCANPSYHGFVAEIKDDQTIEASRRLCRNGVAYQDKQVGSNLEQGRGGEFFNRVAFNVFRFLGWK